ncbi:MAG: hypothetical protein CMH47_05755 [Muricauda sp.]|nr:efflux RND transporter permease subunit [uncultured Allomuricauda sp.]MBC71781.1 hypothetical protein [Allomuricauda sp.]
MKLPQLAISNRLFVLTSIVLLIFIGYKSYKSMPRSEDPFLELPKYSIVVVYPGASPEDMEELIVDPIEELVDELDDIEEIKTEITNGLAVIKIDAEFGIDYDEKYDDIVTEIGKIRTDLPPGIIELEINQYKPEDRNVVHQYALVSKDVEFRILYDLAEDFEKQLEKSNVVKKVEIEASPKEEIRISFDFQKMAQLDISLKQVVGVLQSSNANIPGGSLKSGKLTFNIKTSGSFESLDEIRDIAITAKDNQIVYLKNIATVNYDYEDSRWIARYNGQKAIYLSVYQKKGGNILKLSEEIGKKADTFKKSLPKSIKLETPFEQATAVKSRINDFLSNLLQGVFLVGLVVLVFLGWRPASIVVTVIPLSILIAIVLLDFTGYALHQISISSLVIALGLLVDNAIVVVENIIRFKKEGYTISEAAAKGTSEVGYAIISSTITTVLAFAPLALLESGPGAFLRSLPLTVIFVLMGSLLLALVFTPILAQKLIKNKKESKPPVVSKALDGFIENRYSKILTFALRRGWAVLLVGVIILIGSIMLFPKIGVSFFPTADKPMILLNIEQPYSSNINHTDNTLRYIESVLDTTDYVKSYTTNAGHGNPQVYYNRIPEEYKTYHGEVLVNFKDWEQEKFYRTLNAFRKVFSNNPNGKISFRELQNGAPFEAPIEILLIGEDLKTLKKISNDIENIIAKTKGVIDVENPLARAKTDIKVDVNRDKAAIYNVPLLDIDQTVRASLNGLTIDKVKISKEDEDYPVVVRIPFKDRPTINDFSKVSVPNANGDNILLNQLASINFDQDYAKINHYNTDRNTAITANVLNPEATRTVTEQIITELEAYNWPSGYTYHVGGEYESQSESFGDLGTLLLVALILIFAVLVLQFRSIRQPLLIFSAIPLAISGSFIALFITGWSFSFFAFVGLISLVGIVVNNSIILVDYTNQLLKEGHSKIEAITTASKRRFTPIVLTTLTTIVGLLPLTVSGTSLWSPLGWTLIGGMISSTLLTLLIVPLLYKWLTKTKRKL